MSRLFLYMWYMFSQFFFGLQLSKSIHIWLRHLICYSFTFSACIAQSMMGTVVAKLNGNMDEKYGCDKNQGDLSPSKKVNFLDYLCLKNVFCDLTGTSPCCTTWSWSLRRTTQTHYTSRRILAVYQRLPKSSESTFSLCISLQGSLEGKYNFTIPLKIPMCLYYSRKEHTVSPMCMFFVIFANRCYLG